MAGLSGKGTASNGNLADDGVRTYAWDALNRLKEVRRKSDSAIIGQYVYDAQGRRIQKIVSNGGLSTSIPNGTTEFAWSGWQTVEERDASNNPTKQYVWGIYIDELLQQKNITALNNFAANDELYPLQDLLYRTMGLADSSGTVREAYDTDAYGNTLIFRNTGTPPGAIAWSDSDTQVAFPTCETIFTGRRFDPETEIYYYRMRYYAPTLGRFLSRDPIGFADTTPKATRLGFYEYVGGGPLGFMDPTGYQREFDQGRFDQLINELGDDDYRVREEAQRKLERLLPNAPPTARDAAIRLSIDPQIDLEIRTRLRGMFRVNYRRCKLDERLSLRDCFACCSFEGWKDEQLCEKAFPVPKNGRRTLSDTGKYRICLSAVRAEVRQCRERCLIPLVTCLE